MATRENMKKWVVEALTSVGGTAWPKDVAKYVWDNYEIEIRGGRFSTLHLAVRCTMGCYFHEEGWSFKGCAWKNRSVVGTCIMIRTFDI